MSPTAATTKIEKTCLINSFNKNIRTAYYMPGIMLGAGGTMVKLDTFFPSPDEV